MMKTNAYTMTCNKADIGSGSHELTHCLNEHITRTGKNGRGRVSDIKPEVS